MIVMALINFVLDTIGLLISTFNIPSAGEQFDQITNFVTDMFSNAENLIGFFIPWEIVKFGLPIVILLLSAEHIYHFIMWILRKIPMLGIE